MLSIDHASVVYPDAKGGPVRALDDVSLDVAEGEFLVVLGPSGCGKTTLLNLIAGFQTPSSGEIRLNGDVVSGPGGNRGVVFQGDALLPWLNVRDNVAFGPMLAGVAKDVRRLAAEEMLAVVGLSGFADHRIWQLSGGMRQRVGLARALNADPAVLLMDEPLGALDALTREEMQSLLLDVWVRTRKTIVLITHAIEEAVFLATRLIVMSPRPGRVSASFELAFGRRYARDRNARAIKSDADFIALRERVVALIQGGSA